MEAQILFVGHVSRSRRRSLQQSLSLGLVYIGGDLAPSLGGDQKNFWMTFFKEKISISTPKISDDLFLVIDHVFRIFPIFFQIFPIFTVWNVIYEWPFPHEKKSLFQKIIPSWHLFLLCSYNTTSQNIGGWMHGPSPHLKFFWGTVPPVTP